MAKCSRSAAKFLSPKLVRVRGTTSVCSVRRWTEMRTTMFGDESIECRQTGTLARWSKRLVYVTRNLKFYSSLDRQPMKLTQHRRDVVTATRVLVSRRATAFCTDCMDFPQQVLRYTIQQGCGLGLETVSRRTNVSSRSRLDKNCQCLGLVSVSAIYVLCPRPIFGQTVQATGRSVYGL